MSSSGLETVRPTSRSRLSVRTIVASSRRAVAFSAVIVAASLTWLRWPDPRSTGLTTSVPDPDAFHVGRRYGGRDRRVRHLADIRSQPRWGAVSPGIAPSYPVEDPCGVPDHGRFGTDHCFGGRGSAT